MIPTLEKPVGASSQWPSFVPGPKQHQMWPSSWRTVAMSSDTVRCRLPSTVWTAILREVTLPPLECCVSAEVPFVPSSSTSMSPSVRSDSCPRPAVAVAQASGSAPAIASRSCGNRAFSWASPLSPMKRWTFRNAAEMSGAIVGPGRRLPMTPHDDATMSTSAHNAAFTNRNYVPPLRAHASNWWDDARRDSPLPRHVERARLRARALAHTGRRVGGSVARGHEPARVRRCDRAGWLQLWRLPPRRRDREALTRDEGAPPFRFGGRRDPRELQWLSDPLRGRTPAGRPHPQR